MENIYISPQVEILEVEIELGFAASSQVPRQISDVGSGGSAF